MLYNAPLILAVFESRPNRFLGKVWIDGSVSKVFIPDPGRLRELLKPGSKVYLLEKDGQWDPIIVRPAKERGYYELIAGEYRLEAAKKLGWKDVETTVKDVDDVTADFLALKTNIIRQSMSEIEEGMAIRRYLTQYNLTQDRVAKELGRSETWVSKRLALVLNLAEEVRKALLSEEITLAQAVIISQLSLKEGKLTPYFKNCQKIFLETLLKEQNKLGRKLSAVNSKTYPTPS